MKIGDIVIHIGANPNQFRIRMAVAFSSADDGHWGSRHTIVFENGLEDWKDQWKTFKGWENINQRGH